MERAAGMGALHALHAHRTSALPGCRQVSLLGAWLLQGIPALPAPAPPPWPHLKPLQATRRGALPPLRIMS